MSNQKCMQQPLNGLLLPLLATNNFPPDKIVGNFVYVGWVSCLSINVGQFQFGSLASLSDSKCEQSCIMSLVNLYVLGDEEACFILKTDCSNLGGQVGGVYFSFIIYLIKIFFLVGFDTC